MHDTSPKPRPAKKTKSDATASTGGSSASTQFEELMEQELRLKCKAAERAFEAQAEKDRTLIRLEELRFLATSTKDLDDDGAYWIKKQKQLIKNKMRNDLGDDDDEDECYAVCQLAYGASAFHNNTKTGYTRSIGTDSKEIEMRRKRMNWRDGLDFASGEEAWYGGEPSGEATSEWRAGFATIPHALIMTTFIPP
ncbi:hypothetical protein Tco_1089521 [Tanacetum coccineum]